MIPHCNCSSVICGAGLRLWHSAINEQHLKSRLLSSFLFVFVHEMTSDRLEADESDLERCIRDLETSRRGIAAAYRNHEGSYMKRSRRGVGSGGEYGDHGGAHLKRTRRDTAAAGEYGDHGLVVCNTPMIPGLPDHLAEICLARVPWVCMRRLARVCKTWASYLSSGNILAVRSRHLLAERLLVVFSIPGRGRDAPRSKNSSVSPWSEWPKMTFFKPNAATREHSGTWLCKPVDVLRWPDCPFIMSHSPFFRRLLSSDSPFSRRPGIQAGLLAGYRVAVIEPHLFIIGGKKPGREPQNDVWRLNLITLKWTKAAPMNVARSNFACCAIGGKIFVAGGVGRDPQIDDLLVYVGGVIRDLHKEFVPLTSVEMYDHKFDVWHVLPPLENARANCLGALLNDSFFVISGVTRSNHDNDKADRIRSAEVFDTSKINRVAEGFDTGNCQWKFIENMWHFGSPSELARDVVCFDQTLFMLDGKGKTLKSYDQETNQWNDVRSVIHQDEDQETDHLVSLPTESLCWIGVPCEIHHDRRSSLFPEIGNPREIHHDGLRLRHQVLRGITAKREGTWKYLKYDTQEVEFHQSPESTDNIIVASDIVNI